MEIFLAPLLLLLAFIFVSLLLLMALLDIFLHINEILLGGD